MRGIAGIIGIGRTKVRSGTVEQMGQCLRHDPGWTVGSLSKEELGLSVAWVSSEKSACVPSWNETKDICIVFTGHNFAEPGKSSGLKACGHRLPSHDSS